MKTERISYCVKTNIPKKNGQPLNQNDFINVGYMAGRYGISLDGNLNTNNLPKTTKEGTLININSCTCDLFEKNLNSDGINFNKLT